jgi:hypothetical protein
MGHSNSIGISFLLEFRKDFNIPNFEKNQAIVVLSLSGKDRVTGF